MKIVIVGAGMAGLACAEALGAAGLDVTLFDKGRAPGGRMSTRRVETAAGEASFDHGAQFFTARDLGFRERVERWRKEGLAAPWPAAGPEAWVGTPAMNAPIKEMAGHAKVQWSRLIDDLSRDSEAWRVGGQLFDVALIATPAEQAAPLLQPWEPSFAAKAAATPSAPCWTVMAAFAERLRVSADVLRDEGAIGWAARNSAKPARSGPESWVVHANPDWSRDNLEAAPEAIVTRLLDILAQRIGVSLPVPLTATAHRWRYARSGSAGDALLWSGKSRLGACGDWLIGPRVEAAWVSGNRLAAKVLEACA